MPNFYQLLSVEPTATAAEIKRAFRVEIARYHPDKVLHLGKEFQALAASRAAALTEAYRTLMDAQLRAEYDRTHIGAAPASSPTPPSHRGASPDSTVRATPAQPPSSSADADRPSRFASERKDRDDFVRKATLGRFRAALAAELGTFEEVPSRVFDLDFAVTSKRLFSRNGSTRFAVKFVEHIDKLAVQEVWNAAQKAGTAICVFVIGSRLAPAKELSNAIADLRKRAGGGLGISLIPIDVRDWGAHIPSDTPDSCRNVLKRLREASV